MWESLHTVRQYLWRYRRGMALGGLCLVMKDLAQALQPLMIRGAVDSFRSGAAFVRFAGYLVGLALIKGIFQYWMRVILIGISRDIEFDLRNDLFAHLIRLSPEYYARTRTGDIMARATNDLNAVRMMLGPGVMYWFETSLTFILAIAIMTRVDWRLAIFAVMPAPAVSLAVILFGRVIHDRPALHPGGPRHAARGLAPALFRRHPRPGGQPGRHPVRPGDSRPLREDPGHVQRHFEPRAGEPGRRAHDPRLRAGESRDAPLRGIEPGVHCAEHPAGARAGPVPAAIGGADRRHVPGGALRGRPAGAGGPHLGGQFCDVQYIHGHAGVAHDRAGVGGQPDAARQRIPATHQRHSARAAIDCRSAGPGEPGRGERRDRVPGRDGGLRQRPRAVRHRPAHTGGYHAGRGGPYGIGQKHASQPIAAAERPHPRRGAVGWHRPAGGGPGGVAAGDTPPA